MIINKLEVYWTLCKIYRRAVDLTQRREALGVLRTMAALPGGGKQLRFVDLEPKVTIRVKGDGDGPNS